MSHLRVLAALLVALLLLSGCTPKTPSATEQARTAFRQIKDRSGSDRFSELWLVLERPKGKPDQLFAALANTPGKDSMAQHMWSGLGTLDSRPWEGTYYPAEATMTFDELDIDAILKGMSTFLDTSDCRGFLNDLLMARLTLKPLGRGHYGATLTCNDSGGSKQHLLDGRQLELPTWQSDLGVEVGKLASLHQELTGETAVAEVRIESGKDKQFEIAVQGSTQRESVAGGSCFPQLRTSYVWFPMELRCTIAGRGGPSFPVTTLNPEVINRIKAQVNQEMVDRWSITGSRQEGPTGTWDFQWKLSTGPTEITFDAQGNQVAKR